MVFILQICACVLFLWTIFLQAEKQYYVSQNKSTWTVGSNMCTLATPPIDFHILTLNISNIEITEDLWVGYYVASLDIEFIYVIGCVHNEDKNRPSSYNGKSLGRCFTSCDSAPYFGMSYTRCVCFDSRPTNISRDPICDIQCEESRCNPCDINGYTTLYKVYSGDENIQLIDRHETFYTFLRSMCQSGSNKLEISKVKHFVQTNYAVVKYRETRPWPIPTQIPTFGYAKSSQGEIRTLSFNSPLQKLRALCIKGSEAKTFNRNDSSSSIIVPIGISASVTTVVAMVVVIIILKKRGKIQTKCCRKVQSDSSDYTTPEIHLAIQNDYTSLSPHYDHYAQISVVELPSTSYTDYNAIHDKNEHLYSNVEKHGAESYTNTNIASHDNKY